MANGEQWRVGVYPVVGDSGKDDPIFDEEDAALKHAVKLTVEDENAMIGVWYVYWGGAYLKFLVCADGVYRQI